MKNRRLNRLRFYDYSRSGSYFVTLCLKGFISYFGEVKNGVVELTEIGHVANKCWIDIGSHFPHIAIDEFIVMPDHIHGILNIQNVGNNNYCSLHGTPRNYCSLHGNPQNYCSPHETPRNYSSIWQTKWSKSISSAIRGFKIGVTKWARLNGYHEFEWQKSYYDVIIRNQTQYMNIKNYIIQNPKNWGLEEKGSVLY